MGKISAQNLNAKKVVDSEGREIGVFHNMVVDAVTGMLTELVVKPATELDTSKFKKESDYIYIPAEAIKTMTDYIMVDSAKMRGPVRA